MRLSLATITLIFLAEQTSQALALVHRNAAADISSLYRQNAHIERGLHRRASAILNRELDLQRRVDAPVTSAAPMVSSSAASAPSTMDSALWNNQTEAACMQALTSLNGVATNPAGVAVCYNVPYFDKTTGVFKAELRLYRISPPTDNWGTQQQQDVSVDVTYPYATIASGNTSMMRREVSMLSWPPIRDIEARDTLNRRDAPRELSILNFVGRLNSTMMGQDSNDTTTKALLEPDMRLVGAPQNGKQVSTTVSCKEAAFVNGIFAEKAVVPASPAVPQPSAFVLPGTTLGIFPVGLIITGAWTVLFIGTVAFGTIGRIRFREAYRRRKKRGLNVGPRAII